MDFFYKRDKSLIQFPFEGGEILQTCQLITETLIKKIHRNPDHLNKVNSREFEEMVFELFHSFGYEVELTKRSRDGGRDVIAIKNTEVKVKYLIERKRPNKGNIIGIRPVRELFGVKNDEGATKAILATTTFFQETLCYSQIGTDGN